MGSGDDEGSGLTSFPSSLLIDVFSMSDTKDFNQDDFREDVIDNAVDAFSYSVRVMRADEFFYTLGCWIIGKSFNGFYDAAYSIGRQLTEFFYR